MRLAAAGVAAACLATVAPAPVQQPITREVYLMGTRAALTTWDGDRRAGLLRLERLLKALERTEALLSTWRPDSEVSALNAGAGSGALSLSAALCAQLRVLDALASDTAGTFDPAVGALAAAWDIHGKGRLPAAAEIAAARQQSGWGQVSFDPHACTLALPPHFSIDVGAFGKGEALDRARDAVAGDGSPWLIDLGGQIAASGAPPARRGWDVAIAHPLGRSLPVLRLHVVSGSLATSAGSERDLRVNGRRIGHILDPRTGRPAPFTGSVTVWHESALVADALSTALYVMGPDEGLRWADARGLAVCYLTGPAGANRATVAKRPSRAFVAKFTISVP